DLDESQYPTFVSFQSTDNIPVESMWSYWQKAKGTTIRQLIASGYKQSFFIVGSQLYFNLFQWLWLKIVQRHLDGWKNTFNNSAPQYQCDKRLPSGVSPQVVFDFPERYNLQNVGCQVEPAVVQALQDSVVISQSEAFRWVSEEFDALA
ncbi:hypothetical protein GYMLUDRAFT_107508, partial [Collybiopsis luxurians FD-317 M1]